MKLEGSLGECTLALLRKIAANHAVVAGEDRLRSELARLLHRRLLEPGYLGEYVAGLLQQEMEALQLLRDQGWTAKAFVLDRRFPRRGPTGAIHGRGEPGPALSLLQKGLLFRGFAALGSWRGEVYYLPEELRPLLLSSLPASAPEEPVDLLLQHPPDAVAERHIGFDLFCLLSFLRREPRRLVRGSLSRADLAKLEKEVTAVSTDLVVSRWEERWRFLLHLCLAAGWIRREGSWLRPGRGVDRVLAGGAQQPQDRLLERYLKDRGWSDLAAAGKVRQPLGTRQIDEAAARRLLVHYLGEVAGEGWTDEGGFFRWIQGLNPDFLREDYSSPAWAVVQVATDVELFGPSSWDAVEGEWIRYVLQGPLQWLGAVRWGLTRGGKAEGFQWVPGGREGAQRSVSAGEGRGFGIALQEDLGVAAPYEGELGLLYRLEPYLELHRRDRTSLYRLTMASVLGGLEKGGSWEELRGMVESLAGGTAVTAVGERLSDWVSQYGRFALEGATVLTAATPEDAELLPALPGVAACLYSRLGARSYRVYPERVRELVDRLRKAGYPPKVDPTAGLEGMRRTVGEASLLRESLFALKLLGSLHPNLDLREGAQAVRRLEAALGPEESGEISLRVQEAMKQLERP